MLIDYFCVQLRQSVKVLLPLDSTTEFISINRGKVCLIPGVSPALLGVVNQRGKLLWVLDLSDLLNLPPAPTQPRNQDNLTLVVLTNSSNSLDIGQTEHQIGCVVSAIQGIIPLDPIEFNPLSAKLSSSLESFAAEMTVIGQAPITVLDVNAVLAAIQTSVSANCSTNLL